MQHPTASTGPIQRRITLLRHAKAAPDAQGDDHDRPLSSPGRDAAMELGSWLQQNDLVPQLVLCSTARRARETLAALGGVIATELHAGLYLASPADMLGALQACDDAVLHVMLIGHNPGMHDLTAMLTRAFVREADAEAVAQGFPTCGLVSMTVEAANWSALATQTATVDALRFSGTE